MDTARIAVLLAPFIGQSLPLSRLDQISTYIDLLLRWNARINLTAIRQEEQIVTRHFGESLFMARHLFPPSVARAPSPANADSGQMEGTRPIPHLRISGTPSNPPHVLDIGSGAGFPALPLKIWAPNIHLTLIESNHKKAAFLREIARALTLTNINVITDRAETLAVRLDFPRAEIVTLRAVERFEAILPHAAALVIRKGSLALLIGASQVPHLKAPSGVKWNPPMAIPQSHTRVLSIGIRE
jgi:16S rRNA (guanine527-N7)-methyltransferase